MGSTIFAPNYNPWGTPPILLTSPTTNYQLDVEPCGHSMPRNASPPSPRDLMDMPVCQSTAKERVIQYPMACNCIQRLKFSSSRGIIYWHGTMHDGQRCKPIMCLMKCGTLVVDLWRNSVNGWWNGIWKRGRRRRRKCGARERLVRERRRMQMICLMLDGLRRCHLENMPIWSSRFESWGREKWSGVENKNSIPKNIIN